MTGGAATRRPGQAWSIASFALALCASVTLLIAPMYESAGSQQTTETSGGLVRTSTAHVGHQTLAEQNNLAIALFILLVPVALTAAPLVLRRWTQEVRLFTIGGLYLPSLISMLIAAYLGRRSRTAQRGRLARSDIATP